MAETRPRGEQLRFLSSFTGSHILDDYLEAAELGGRALADILSDIFDGDSGDFRSDLWEFRVDPDTSVLQYRIGDFADEDTGWTSMENSKLLRWRGDFAAGTEYAKLDLFISGLDTYLVHTAHTSSSTPDTDNATKIVDGTALKALKDAAETAATSAAADKAATNADAAATAADKIATAADAAATAADKTATNADAAATAADAIATAADRVQTGLDAAATAADKIATAADKVATNADAASTASDRTAAETARTGAEAAQSGAETAETSAESHASTATTQAGIATTKAGEALSSANSAATALTDTETARDQTLGLLDSFDDRYLGAKSSAPTTDNDGDPLQGGALYFDETLGAMQLWTGTEWVAAYVSSDSVLFKSQNLADLTDAAIARQNLGLGTVATEAAASFLLAASNLSDVASASTALANLDGVPSAQTTPNDLNTVTTSGFYRLLSSNTNCPSGYGQGQMIVSRSADTVAQIIIAYDSAKMAFRGAINSGGSWAFSDWSEVWSDNNDSSASGLDADLTDGKHIWTGTQSAYDAIATKDANTLYFITE